MQSFVFDIATNGIETISTINGLSGDTISTLHYSEAFELLIIGYETGLIEIVSDFDQDVLTVIDILDKPTIPPTNKKINHFNEFNDVVYISTDYGISVYNLNNLEFGDTYFIGNAGSQIIVKETTIFGDYIYAACQDNNGLKKALHLNNDLIDFQQWQTVTSGNYLNIQVLNNKLYVVHNNKKLYDVINDGLVELHTYADTPLDVKTTDNNLIVTTNNNVFVYDNSFNLESNIQIVDEYNTEYTSGIMGSDNSIYIGTVDYGILRTTMENTNEFLEIHPQGPLLNNSFSIEAAQNNLWVSFGDYKIWYDPAPWRRRGVSHLVDEEWYNIPYDSVFGAVNLNDISINPNNNSQVFISSFQKGILELNNGSPITLHDHTNSGLESLIVPNAPKLC